jgi:hypothetical protein
MRKETGTPLAVCPVCALKFQIPSLNSVALHDVADQQLVRFTGMVQDMQNPELYLEQYEVLDSVSKQRTVRWGKYRDIPACGVSTL